MVSGFLAAFLPIRQDRSNGCQGCSRPQKCCSTATPACSSKRCARPLLLKEMASGYTSAAMKALTATQLFDASTESQCAAPCERRVCEQARKPTRCERRRELHAQARLHQLRCFFPDLPLGVLDHCQLRQLSVSCRRAGMHQTALGGPRPIATLPDRIDNPESACA